MNEISINFFQHSNKLKIHRMTNVLGHWTTSASSPDFFFFQKVDIFIPLQVYTYEVTACLILLTTLTLLRRHVNFSCSGHF